MAVKDFDWLQDTTKNLRDNLRAKPGSRVEKIILEWLIERRDVARAKLDEPKGSNPSRDSNATGALRASIGWEPLETNSNPIVVNVKAEDYWDRLNKGVNGTLKDWGSPYSFDSMGLTPQFQTSIRTWMSARGIEPREPDMSREQLSYIISRSVIEKGVMPVPFMDEAFNEKAIFDLADKLGRTVKTIFE